VLDDAVRSRPLRAAPGELPDEVLRVLADPPPVSSWIQETVGMAVLLAIHDQHFAGREGEYHQWVYDRNARLFRRPLYRILFAVISPSRLFAGTEKRWAAFHRGTGLMAREERPGAAKIVLTCPAHLWPEPAARAFMFALKAALDAAGARKSRMDLVSYSPIRIDCSAQWSA
jgi:hypothetical protein